MNLPSIKVYSFSHLQTGTPAKGNAEANVSHSVEMSRSNVWFSGRGSALATETFVGDGWSLEVVFHASLTPPSIMKSRRGNAVGQGSILRTIFLWYMLLCVGYRLSSPHISQTEPKDRSSCLGVDAGKFQKCSNYTFEAVRWWDFLGEDRRGAGSAGVPRRDR